MAFAGGAITLKRFSVTGTAPARADEAMIQALAAHAIGADSLRAADHLEVGWITGEHILDTDFSFARNAVADGLHWAMRIDSHRPPADLVRSYCRENERAMLQATGREFLSRTEKREAREQALARADQEARAGAFRRMKSIPVFWDFRRREVYLGTTATTAMEAFATLFRDTFDLEAVPLSAGELAARWSARTGESRYFEDCRPAFFVPPPEGVEPAEDLPGGDEARSRDFLGSEWLTWLWYAAEVESAEIAVAPGRAVAVFFEKTLELKCAFNLSGAISVRADDPAGLPESHVALAGGKRPVRAGLQIGCAGEAFGLTLRGDAMSCSGVRLTPPNEASTPRDVFEDRMQKLRELIEALDGLYGVFLRRRLSGKWPATLNAIRNWTAAGAAGPRRSAEPAVS